MKRKRKNRKNRRIALLFVLIFVLIAIFLYIFVINRDYVYEVQQTISLNTPGYQYDVFNNTIVTFEKKELVIYTENETHKYSFSETLSEVSINNVGNVIYVTDRKMGKVYIFDQSAIILEEINFNQEILSIKEDRKKQLIGFHTREKTGTEHLIFFNGSGKETGRINGLKDGKIIDFSIGPTGEKVAISVITYGESIKANILFVDVQGEIQGGKTFENEIFPQVFLMDNGELICVGNKRILKLNQNKEIVWEEPMVADRVAYSTFMDGLIICTSKIGTTNVILLGNEKDVLLNTSVDGNIMGIKSNEKRTILYGNRSLFLVNQSAIKETKLPKDIMWADLLINGLVVIGSNDKIEVLKEENFIR